MAPFVYIFLHLHNAVYADCSTWIRASRDKRMRSSILILILLLLVAHVRAEQDVQLLAPDKPAMGWNFDNGKEFPGAKGTLTVDPEVKHDGRESLRLIGDFSGGGNYVQMGRDVSALHCELSTLTF